MWKIEEVLKQRWLIFIQVEVEDKKIKMEWYFLEGLWNPRFLGIKRGKR